MRAENGRDSKGRPQLVYCINEKQQNRVTLPSVSGSFRKQRGDDTVTDKLAVLDLFSGIGGFSLGLERTGGSKPLPFARLKTSRAKY